MKIEDVNMTALLAFYRKNGHVAEANDDGTISLLVSEYAGQGEYETDWDTVPATCQRANQIVSAPAHRTQPYDEQMDV